jgi:hypothetical protein
MPNSTHYQPSDTRSTTSTLVPSSSETRTTLTGRPLQYTHDTLSNTSCGDSFHVGANTLPPGYTDSSLVHIPIKITKYLQPSSTQNLDNDVKYQQPKKAHGVFSRLSGKFSGHGSEKDDEGLKIVAMSRGDYLKYWAKGKDGKFRDGVVEPEGGRAEWLASALERQEREGLGKVTPRRTKGTEGGAHAVGSLGAMIGSLNM